MEELEITLKQTQNSWYEDTKVIEKQQKEIEELKEKTEYYERIIVNKECEKQYKEEAEQKEKKAYIKGTNDADELCNKKWEDKIKAKIEEVQKMKAKAKDIVFKSSLNYIETELQSLLEKE